MRSGDLVGERFEIERLAGTGGMGRVYRARDRHTGDMVALKVLHTAMQGHSARLLREARAIAQLHHPGIVRYIAHGEKPAVFVAMEWLDGEDLGERLRRELLSATESLELARRVAEALAAAHARGVVHRDIKPGNLFLVEQAIDQVKVLDFGIARLDQNTNTQAATATGQVLGTVGYMAPEQAASEGTLDARVDVFALGCVLFECLSGRRAFEGESAVAVLAKVLLCQPPRLSSVRPGTPPALDDLVRRMIAKEPSARPPLGVIVAELEALLTKGRALGGAGGAGAPGVLSAQGARWVHFITSRDALVGTKADRPTLAWETSAGPDRSSVVEKHGGWLETLIDGSPIAVFEETAPAVDAAAQLARCALALAPTWPGTTLVAGLGPCDGSGRQPSVKALTHLLAALPETGEGPVERDRAILLDGPLAALVADRFELRPEAGHMRLLEERPHPLLRAADPGTFVGRSRELAFLEDLVAESLDEPRATAVLITGPAGSGKSRLGVELIERLGRREPPPEVWSAHARRSPSSRPLALLQAVLRSVPGAPERPLALSARGLAESIRTAEAGSTDGLQPAWEELLGRCLAGRATVIVLDDLQWADTATLAFLDAALRSSRRKSLVLVGLARPALHEVYPALWSQHRLHLLRLEGLGRRAAVQIASRTEADAGVPEDLLTSADGSPLCLEELAGWVAAGRPAMLQTVLAEARARISGLEPDARRLLRGASVYGQHFWLEAVAVLMSGQENLGALRPILQSLEEQGLVARQPVSRFPEREELVFASPALREAAYGMLTDRDRRIGHKLAAEWLEVCGERDALALAVHFERGGDPRRAVVWYLWATEQAFEGDGLEAVMATAEAGVACGAEGAVLGELRLFQAEASGWSGGPRRQPGLAQVAMELLSPGSGAWLRAVAQHALACAREGEIEELRGTARILCGFDASTPIGSVQWLALGRVIAALLAAGEVALAGQLATQLEASRPGTYEIDAGLLGSLRDWLRAIAGLHAGAPELFAFEGPRIAEVFEAAGHTRHAVLVEADVAQALGALGAYDQAVELADRTMARATRLGLMECVDRTRARLGRYLLEAGDPERAEQETMRALGNAVAHDDLVAEGQAAATLAFLLARAADLDRAENTARRVAQALGYTRACRGEALAVLARILLDREQPGPALEAAQRSIELLSTGSIQGDALPRWVRVEALEALGDLPAARAAIREAGQRLAERAARVSDPRYRAWFLERVPEHARTVLRAATLGA